MNGSFVFSGFDNEKNVNSSYEFDPQTDFSQFLEEAKRHSAHDTENPRAKNYQNEQDFTNHGVKKSKKSWKNVLFPFWKLSSDKKSKRHSKETSKYVHATSPKPRVYVSGPIYGTRPNSSGRYQHHLLGSGPLNGLFQTIKREENELVLPYVSLEKLNQPTNDATVYGPVYLVT